MLTLQLWNEIDRRMRDNLAENMPSLIVAHYLIAVAYPKLVRSLGKEAIHEYGRQMTRDLCLRASLCTHCQDRESLNGDDVCVKCLAEFDQFEASVEDEL